jgi:hypothetical protein
VARWQELEASDPEFTAALRRYLDARIHKTIATLRADGSPRISGIETFFAGSIDPPEWQGDAKLTGRAEEITDPDRRLALFRTQGSDPPSPESHLFRADIREATFVRLNEAHDRLVIRLWRPGQEVRSLER